MTYKLGVLVLHGMGSQTPNYADPMIRELEKRIRALRVDPNETRWEPAYLAGVLQKKQTRLWREPKSPACRFMICPRVRRGSFDSFLAVHSRAAMQCWTAPVMSGSGRLLRSERASLSSLCAV